MAAGTMDVRFTCVGCGRCCHDLRLPLSVDEAIGWIERGGTVEILCDASPLLIEQNDPQMRYRSERAVPATSGALPIGVSLTLVATFAGACPHLQADLRCGAYDRRPEACRIYPAELRPGLEINPAAKQCPPEAWGPDGDRFADPETAAAVDRARAAGLADVEAKARLAALLGLDRAALANEGLVVWRSDPDVLLAALYRAQEYRPQGDAPAPGTTWTFVSGRQSTLDLIAAADGVGMSDAALADDVDYIRLG